MADITQDEYKNARESLRLQKQKLNDLKKELQSIKQNRIQQEKQNKKSKEIFIKTKKQKELYNERNQEINDLSKEEIIILKDKRKEDKKTEKELNQLHKERVKLIKKGNIEDAKNLKLTQNQIKFYEEVVKKDQEREKKLADKEESRKFLKEEKLLKKSTAGLLGNFVGGKITGILKEFLPGFGGIKEAIGFVREKKKEQADIAQRRINEQIGMADQNNGILEPSKENSNESISGNLSDLIETNRKGFNDIIQTMIKIDQGEDIEEVMNQRDEERRGEEIGKETLTMEKEKEKGGLFGKIPFGKIPFGKIPITALPIIAGVIAGVPLLIEAFKNVKDLIDEIKGTTQIFQKGGLKKGVQRLLFGENFEEQDIKEKGKSLLKRSGQILKKTTVDIIPGLAVPKFLIKQGLKTETGQNIKENIEDVSKNFKGYIKGQFKKRQSGGFIGDQGPELFIGGEKGKEFVLDNKATNMFFNAVQEYKKTKQVPGTSNKEQLEMWKQMLQKMEMLNQNTQISTKFLNEIAKKTLGNVNIVSAGQMRQESAPSINMVYEPINKQ